MMDRFEVNNIVAGYGNGPDIVIDVSFQLKRGEFVSILGRNGCGKTTLLKSVLGLLPVRKGEVNCNNKELLRLNEEDRAKEVAYVPQAHRPPFPFLVEDVVRMGRTPHLSRLSMEKAEDVEIAYECMVQVGIESLAKRPYTHLSGGQQQLVIIARALAQRANFIIMDEPTSSLDYGNQYRVLAQIRKLCDEINIGALMVTHDPAHCFYAADRVMLMDGGKILKSGRSEDVIDSNVLSELYDFPITVDNAVIDGNLEMICVPKRFINRIGGRI